MYHCECSTAKYVIHPVKYSLFGGGDWPIKPEQWNALVCSDRLLNHIRPRLWLHHQIQGSPVWGTYDAKHKSSCFNKKICVYCNLWHPVLMSRSSNELVCSSLMFRIRLPCPLWLYGNCSSDIYNLTSEERRQKEKCLSNLAHHQSD